MALVRERITSEDYGDLIVNYGEEVGILEAFSGYSYYFLNSITAVVHIPVENITDKIIRQHGYSSLPTCYGPISDLNIEASGINQLRNIPNLDLRGEGVLIGILDSGIDYTNPIFKYSNNTTKIASIWDQTIESDDYPPGFFYGTEYSREQINEALTLENPFELVPSRDEVGHGTAIAGIAAGNSVPESDFYGVAPDSELVIVKLKGAKTYLKDFFRIPQDSICYQETDIITAVQYLRKMAISLGRPIAICIALGSSQGAHDGMGTLSEFLSLIGTFPGNVILTAAGNEGNARRHFGGLIDPAIGHEVVELNVGENVEGFSMELWGNTPTIFSIDIQSPAGEYIPRITGRLDDNREVRFVFEGTTINVDYQMIETQSGDQLILVRFKNPTKGLWIFRVFGIGDLDKTYNIWLPMQDFIGNDTYFIKSSPYITILSPGNATVPITITAYNAANESLFIDSSRGFTRIGSIKPNVAAPGVNVIGPTLNQGFAPFSGTSVAVSHATGIAAMMLEWGIVRGNHPRMNSVEVKKFMLRGARRSESIEYPNRDWGYGILDIYSVFLSLITDIIGF